MKQNSIYSPLVVIILLLTIIIPVFVGYYYHAEVGGSLSKILMGYIALSWVIIFGIKRFVADKTVIVKTYALFSVGVLNMPLFFYLSEHLAIHRHEAFDLSKTYFLLLLCCLCLCFDIYLMKKMEQSFLQNQSETVK